MILASLHPYPASLIDFFKKLASLQKYHLYSITTFSVFHLFFLHILQFHFHSCFPTWPKHLKVFILFWQYAFVQPPSILTLLLWILLCIQFIYSRPTTFNTFLFTHIALTFTLAHNHFCLFWQIFIPYNRPHTTHDISTNISISPNCSIHFSFFTKYSTKEHKYLL